MSGWGAEYEEITATCSGAILRVRRRNLLVDDFSVDTALFEQDYTTAASTANNVWEGGYKFIEFLNAGFGEKLKGVKVVELGSGTGLVGLAAAASGANVLLTDVASVATGSLADNVTLNVDPAGANAHLSGGGWSNAAAIGALGGSVTVAPLDWTIPIEEQLRDGGPDPRHADVILAAETVWLEELVEPFVGTVVEILTGPRSEDTRARGPKQCYLAYKERTKADSTSFAGVKRLFDAFARNGCVIEDIPHSFGEDVRFHKVMVEDSE